MDFEKESVISQGRKQLPLTEEDSAVESRGSENRRLARADMCRISALGKKEAREKMEK